MSNPALREVGNVSVYVTPERWDESVRFYADTLGLTLVARDAAYAVFRFASGPTLLLEPDTPDGDEGPASGRFTGFSITVLDVDRVHAELSAKGVRFVGLPQTQAWGGRLAYVVDPSGNQLTLCQYPTNGV